MIHSGYSHELYESKIREKTPFEIIREGYYDYLLDKEAKYVKDLEHLINYTYLNQVVIKPHAVVKYSVPYRKRYNKKSLENLSQNQPKEAEDYLKRIRSQETIRDVNEWSAEYLSAYETKKEKKYNGLPSKQVASKIYRTASVFVRSILSGFISTRGFRQRSITFCTFTLTESQKHTDDVIIKMFVDFIDHLKKVNNYIIDPITKERTKEKALRIENYIWRAETQENGNIHFHLIADTFLNQDMLRRVWNNYLENMGYKYGYGAANVNSLKRDKNNNKILNVERYLCKYMTKQPLRNAYKNYRKKELDLIPDSEKYRRPIIGKFWGCSHKLLKLEYPKFYDKKGLEVVKKMRDKMRKIESESFPKYVEVYAGDTRKVFLGLDYPTQRELKNHYLLCLEWLYSEVPCCLN